MVFRPGKTQDLKSNLDKGIVKHIGLETGRSMNCTAEPWRNHLQEILGIIMLRDTLSNIVWSIKSEIEMRALCE
jgi:hypothetical protein